MDTLISVIIPTCNNATTLPGLLASLDRQTYRNFEVVIVDKHSSDATPQIARSHNCKLISNDCLVSEARNVAASAAGGEYILFIDSDHELEPDVLEECNALAKQGVKMAEIPEMVIASGYWGECRKLEALCYLGDDTIECPRFIEKKLFLDMGGYTAVDAEDWDLRERLFALGHKLHRTQSHKLHHEGVVSLRKRLSKKFRYTRGINTFLQRNPGLALKQTPIFRKAFFRNWKLLVTHPLTAIGLLVMKILETLTFALGIACHTFGRFIRRH